MKNRDKQSYLRQYPELRRWLNQCIICFSEGYKPEMPKEVYLGALAQNIREFYNPLPIDELSICQDCAKHLKL